MVYSRICLQNAQVAKPSPEIAKYHICQLFLQPGQLMYLHMDGLNFTMKLWAGLLVFMSAVHAMHGWLYLKRPAVDGRYKQKPEVATRALTSLWVVNTALGK